MDFKKIFSLILLLVILSLTTSNTSAKNPNKIKPCDPNGNINTSNWKYLGKECNPQNPGFKAEKWQCQTTIKYRKDKKSSVCKITEPSPIPSPSISPIQNEFMVKPYLVYPADKPMFAEYQQAVDSYLIELQNWYKQKVGKTFALAPLKVVRSDYNYLTMRCGPNPSENCKNNQNTIEGNWPMYINIAIHNGVEAWEEKTVALIFSAGGGGWAGGALYGNYTGWAIVGDWVLEPISGKANDWGIPCSYSSGWQCSGGVPKGTPAHELGHAFGLPHPDLNLYPGQSIMRWHGDYPTVGFLPHEVELLKNSPFFK
ncbi:hypothetical protein HYS97_03095 [Candidatus Daviesbacteria bacterium]|nr:hypothetical protein [Candidatus Daviesbacteria bacterium]